MAGKDLTLAMRLLLDAQQFVRGLNTSNTALGRFVSAGRTELDKFRQSFSGVRGTLASLGVGIGATAALVQSARLDKNLTQIGLTAGVGAGQVANLRHELFQIARDTGQPLEDLQAGFNNLIQSGLSFAQSLETIRATSLASVVTSARPEILTGGLTVAAGAYNFDLAKAGQATELLDKMTVAGRLGNAELENLSSIFARVGVNAQSAGMSFDKTLAFVEGLSKVERQPERLATLADSTLRVFTIDRYRKAAQAASGVRFYNAAGERRDAIEVLADIKKRFDTLSTDRQRDRFINQAFGQADQDTIKGLRTLLGTGALGDVSRFADAISRAGGTLQHDMGTAMNNAVDQTGRLKAALRETADDFAKKMNRAVAPTIKKLLDKKEDGGLNLSGGQIAGGLAVGGITALLAKRFGGKLLGSLVGGTASLATGVAMGEGLKQLGVTPVFITGAAPGLSLGGDSTVKGTTDIMRDAVSVGLLSRLLASFTRFAGPIGLGVTAGMVASSVGAPSSSLTLGSGPVIAATDIFLKKVMTSVQDWAAHGPDSAAQLAFMVSQRDQSGLRDQEKFEGTLQIELTDKRTRVTKLESNQPSFEIGFSTGPMFALP